MGSDTLPHWVLWMQALATPTIAVIGSWVAWQQMRISSRRLDFDLYDRRFAVFVAARTLIGEVVSKVEVSIEAMRTFNLGVEDAPFLLDEKTNLYLTELRKQAAAVQSFKDMVRYQRQYSEALQWFGQQVDGQILQSKFLPTLSFAQRKRSC
ncbi:hypothetical protein F2P47_09270 [Parvibaculum sedimenti]|uniref:Uncharacterized protein n=1 Tax=Parvibaculum sedimenti TaxID=2608632 RepID=A0A6N6VGV1_9HYPH|nr:hypothetical protein [Parvibaculum sedimenti]KAB7740186.1 hypothetical protein F2P47_09270 [Parvibaculum sedimenti]